MKRFIFVLTFISLLFFFNSPAMAGWESNVRNVDLLTIRTHTPNNENIEVDFTYTNTTTGNYVFWKNSVEQIIATCYVYYNDGSYFDPITGKKIGKYSKRLTNYDQSMYLKIPKRVSNEADSVIVNCSIKMGFNRGKLTATDVAHL